jgi:transcriptional regulator with XRE-family HTH domain
MPEKKVLQALRARKARELAATWNQNPPEMTETVKALRIALGDTQQEFAQRLGLAISTVVRYESTRAPKGSALAKLIHLADENKLEHIVEMFKYALISEAELFPLFYDLPVHVNHLTLDWEARLRKLESALVDNHVKPQVRLDHVLKEISEIRADVSAWNRSRGVHSDEEKPEPLAQERNVKK